MEHKRITILCGHYGSGKTNIAVNMALELKKSNDRVAIADLDIVNPYFRTKDSKEELDRRYREFKAAAQLTPEQKKKFNENVKIDKLKLTNPEKAERLIAKQKMLDEQKKLAEQNKVDENSKKINFLGDICEIFYSTYKNLLTKDLTALY